MKLRLATVLVGALIVAVTTGSAQAASRWGAPGVAEVPNFRMFDIGATDYDRDGNLDLFTTNHKFHSGLLHNDDGQGNMTDLTNAARLGSTPQFPGLEYLLKPQITEPGAYLYATDSPKENLPGVLHLRTESVAASGRLTFEADQITVLRARGGSVEVGRSPTGRPTVDFKAPPGAVIDIRAVHIDLPISAQFDQPQNPNEIRVGTFAIPATTSGFVLNLRDRHGYAFADLAGDWATDVFAVSGGLGGGIRLPGYDGAVQDELQVREGTSYVNSTVGSGLTKGTCRGRQVAAVDINDDGRLDLFEGCEDDRPKVYLQRSRGQFESIEPPNTISTTFRWINLGRGRRPELLAADPAGIRTFAYTEEGWQLQQTIVGNARFGRVTQFAVHDYNEDGEIDVLAVAPSGNTLLKNRRGRLREVSRSNLGIPRKSYAASFVDFDNDGRVDLHLVPQGLLQRVQGHGFNRTGNLAINRDVGAAITAWYDYDNDGLRDPVISSGASQFVKAMRIDRRHNLGPGGHWFEVDLVGLPGNSEGIGSRIAVRAGDREQYGWVGESDDSRYSQGHYRVYFGLGAEDRVRKLTVRWADGAKSTFHNLVADRVATVGHPKLPPQG